MAQILRYKGSIFCVHHPKKKLIVRCDKCKILMCSHCMLGEHLGHQGTDIENIAEDKLRNIDDFITKTKGQRIPDLKQNIYQVEAHINDSVKVLQKGIAEAYEREKHLIELVKKNTTKIVTELKCEIQNINQQFSEFKTDSNNLLSALEAAVDEWNQTKRSKSDVVLLDDILLIDVADEVQTLDEIKIRHLNIQTRTFNPGTNAADLIKKAFGFIRQDAFTEDEAGPPEYASLFVTADDSPSREKKAEGECQAYADVSNQLQLIPMTIVRGDFGFGFKIRDSSEGQFVKEIINTSRCKLLKVNDALHEINGINVKEMAHHKIVWILKGCPTGKEIKIVVQRGGSPD